MGQLKRWFGILTIGVGFVGVILTAFGLVVLWRATSVFSARAVEIADLAVIVKDNADKHIGRAEKLMGNMQQTVSALEQTADKVSGDAEQNRVVVPFIQELDDKIVRALGETRNLLGSIQSGTVMLNQAVGLFDSLSSPMRMFRRSAEPPDNSDVAGLSQSLAETSELIQQVIDFVAQMERQGITDQQAVELKQAVARLGEKLDQGGTRLRSLRTFLQATRDSIVAKRDRTPYWTNAAGTFCTILFVCFGFTQIHLVGSGRSMLAGTSQ